MRSFDMFFDLCEINDWINNRESGDLRRYHAHYDIAVMCWLSLVTFAYSALLALFQGNPQVTNEFPSHKAIDKGIWCFL